MTIRKLVWRGETYVSLRDAAGCYNLQVTEVEQWISAELLPAPTRIDGAPALPARCLGRIATFVRYTRLLGLDISAVRVMIDGGALDPDS